MIGPRPVFEAIIALGKMMHLVSDVSDPNNLFSINRVDLARDFDIEKVF
jgi:hypothetical protein